MKLLTLLALALLVAGCSTPPVSVVSPESSPTANTLGAEATAVKAVPTQSEEPLAATPTATYTSPAPKDMPTVDTLRIRLDGPTETFSLPGEQRPLPKDILQEIGFFAVGGGGGYGDVCDFHEQLAAMTPEAQKGEWMTKIPFVFCGFSADETITVEIISPDGETIVKDRETPYYVSQVEFYYTPELAAPIGVYTARFSGNSGTIEQAFEVIVPPGPRAYWHDERLILFGFEPREMVRLYAFELEGTSDSRLSRTHSMAGLLSLSAWNEYHTDATGQLIIEGLPASRFAVVGEVSGEMDVLGTNDDVESIKSPYPVRVLRPTEARLSKSIDVWTLTPFTQFEEPGTHRSEVTVGPDDTLYWSMIWCAYAGNPTAFGMTDQFLKEALDSIVMSFTINGIEVESPYLRTTEELDSSFLCHRWATLVTNWTTDEPTTLEIKYDLSNTVDGGHGQPTYLPGVYRHVVTVYTGEGAALSTDDNSALPTVADPSLCSGALPTRLAIGDVARVVADRVRVREGPGTDYATVYGTSIDSGRTVIILDGPVCDDGMLWWKGETGLITLTNGVQHNIVGWVAEESGGEWLLEPER